MPKENIMNIYYDENMPYAAQMFAGMGNLYPFAGRTLAADSLIDADVLLVRSITQVNEALLANSPNIKFVGTATIGFDHIDRDYLASRNITFTSAPGCNATSVAEYVLSSLVVLAERYQFSLLTKTVGIIGAGNTGTRLSEKLDALGITYKLYDPFLAESVEDNRVFSTLDEVLACDVVSLHVPKTLDGDHPTFHLLNEQRLESFREDQILINACRGEVIDNQALLHLKQKGHSLTLVMDVWENEPNVLTELIAFCDIATAHIAGYSLEGKARGTEMLYQAVCQCIDKPVENFLVDYLPKPAIGHIELQQEFDEITLNQLVKMVYDVRRDDGIFRQQLASHGFDYIRKTYPVRREFSAITVTQTNNVNGTQVYQLGFTQQ